MPCQQQHAITAQRVRFSSPIVKRLAEPHPKVKHLIHIDDALDLFAEHALAGMIGLLFNGFFGTTEVISLDNVNTTIPGGFLDRNYRQLYVQVAYICACCGYVFVVTAAIAKLLCMIPGLNLRASDHAELIGIDDDQVRRFGFSYSESSTY